MTRALAAAMLCLLATSCVVVDGPVIERADCVRFARLQDVQVVPPRSLRPALEVVSADPKPAYIKQDPPVRRAVVRERYVDAIVTAYCPCARCCGRMTGRTSTRTNAWKPGVAVDPRAIPYGSVLEIDGYDRAKQAEADDTGQAARDAFEKGVVLVDVRMVYHWQARNWGRRLMRIRIVSMPGESL
jgi:3D (Asp-Asp-Asp) domain-containing protein